MKELIEALQIFLKYSEDSLIRCEHEAFFVEIDPDIISWMDERQLEKLGFEETDYGYKLECMGG